jgi:hypothetical protein
MLFVEVLVLFWRLFYQHMIRDGTWNLGTRCERVINYSIGMWNLSSWVRRIQFVEVLVLFWGLLTSICSERKSKILALGATNYRLYCYYIEIELLGLTDTVCWSVSLRAVDQHMIRDLWYLAWKSHRLFHWYVRIGSYPSRDPKDRGLLKGWYCSEGVDPHMIR